MKFYKIYLFLSLLGLTVWGLYKVLPWDMAPAEEYFKPIGERTLQLDERGQWNFVRNHYNHLEITGDEFKGWDTDQQLIWRYGIAFSSYAIPSIVLICPDEALTAQHTMKQMITKMKSRKIWGDWIDYGMGDDPISVGNIMYKGHLNLMYGLYQMMTGDTLFEKEYVWLTHKIVDEMRNHHAKGKHEGADCEPGRYFAQCNAIGLLSLNIYDRLYGTDFTDNEVQWTLDFIKKQLTDEKTGLYQSMYNSVGNFADPYLSGYTNAWTISMLRYFEPEYNNALYNIWKEKFVKSYGPYAVVKEVPEGGPSGLAHSTGLLIAKEMGDIKLFGKLRNAVDKKLVKHGENNHWLYDGINNEINNGPILWTKVHIGWKAIIEHDWGTSGKFAEPDISDLKWTDILSNQLLVVE